MGLHDSAIAADGEGREGLALNFLAEEALEDVERRLLAAGFPPEGTIVDHEWGRALQVRAQLDFHEDMHPAPTFAMLSRGDLRGGHAVGSVLKLTRRAGRH